MTTPTPEQAIRERAEKATEGSWFATPPDEPNHPAAVWAGEPGGQLVAEVYGLRWDMCEQVADFIAHAREDIPTLLATIDSLRASEAALREELEITTREALTFIDLEREARAQLSAALSSRERMRSALTFYADRANYDRRMIPAGGSAGSPVKNDDGAKARRALQEDSTAQEETR